MEEALRRSNAAGVHPEADVLAAFAEDGLLKRERESVLAHLAACAVCRDVLNAASVATPADLAPPEPQRAPVRNLPWLRWAGTAAGLLVAAMGGAALWMRHTTYPPPVTVAVNLPAPPEMANPVAATGAEHAAGMVVPKAPAKIGAGAAGRQAAAPPSALQSELRQSEKGAVPPVSALPADAMIVEARPPAALKMAREAKVVQPQGRSQPSPASQASDSDGSLELAYAPRATPQSLPFSVGGAPPAASKVTAAAPQRHWRISAEGRVEFTFGGDAWQAALAEEGARMRVVSVVGATVWVGGDQMRLYRSADNGATWARIALPAKTRGEHAITHVRFRDADTGTVEADDGTAWNTADGGRTWQ